MAGNYVLSILVVHGLWHVGRTQNLVANTIDSQPLYFTVVLDGVLDRNGITGRKCS